MKRNIQHRNTQQRRHAIMQLLQEQGEVSVEQLVQLFDTSEVTIRKDLTALESNGFLLRKYGGAILMPQEIIEEEQDDELSQRKLVLAKAAAERIRDHNRIIVDSGSTTAALIKQLNRKQGLVVMTNSLSVATALHSLENEPTLLMTGGTWDTRSESFQGNIAEQVLRSYDFDQLFIGADGIDLERGTTTFNELVRLSQVMAEDVYKRQGITLFAYFLWQLSTHGLLSQNEFLQILREDATLNGLVKATLEITQSPIIANAVKTFSTLALVTSFLGVALGLLECIEDLLKQSFNIHAGRISLGLMTFIPPVLFSLFYPEGFILALGYAGQMFAFYAVVLPVALVWKARSIHPNLPYRVWGGNALLVLVLVLGVIITSIPFAIRAGYLPFVVG